MVGGYLTEPPRPAPLPDRARAGSVNDDAFGDVLASPFSQGRQAAWLTLGWIQTVTRGQTPVPDVCGILAGLALVYGEVAVSGAAYRWCRWRTGRRGTAAGPPPWHHAYRRLGWHDVLGQAVIGAGTLAMLGVARGR